MSWSSEVIALYAVITHGDLDGLAAAALYTIYLNAKPSDVKLLISYPSRLHRDLASLLKENIKRIAIIDLGLNTTSYHYVMEVTRSLSLKNISIEWFDHHIWEKEWIDTMSKIVQRLVICRKTCATGLVLETLIDELKHYDVSTLRRFANAVCAVDQWRFDVWEAPFLLRYVEYRNDVKWYRDVYQFFVDMLYNGNMDDLINRIAKYVELYVDEELKVVSTICKDSFKIMLNNTRLGVYVRRKVIPNASIIGNAMLSVCGVDIAVIISNDLSRVSLRSQRCDVRTIATYLGGGGHQRAAGAEIRIRLPLRFLWRLNVAKTKIASIVAHKVINLIERFKNLRGKVCIELCT